jgi:hypothetical protein
LQYRIISHERGSGIRPQRIKSDEEMITRNPIFTIGHSTRTIPEFVALLRQVNVDLLVDVRSIPRSRATPQFNLDVLPGSLAA